MTDAADPLDLVSLQRHREFVRRVAMRVLRDHSAAEDVVQDTWLAAMRSPPDNRPGVKGWLARVARNLSISRLRQRDRRDRREQAVARPEGTASAADIAGRLEAHRMVVDAVAALPEPLRSTVVLRFLEGLPPREIARVHDIPVPTVHSRLRRALSLLRDKLDSRCGGDDSAWTIALLPLIRAPWAPTGAAAAGSGGAGTASLIGGSAMKAKTVAAVSALLLLLAGGAATIAVLSPPSGDGGTDTADGTVGAADSRSRTSGGATETSRGAPARDHVRVATPQDGGGGGDAATTAAAAGRDAAPDPSSESVDGVANPASTAAGPVDAGPVQVSNDTPVALAEEGLIRVLVTDGEGGPRRDTTIRVTSGRDEDLTTHHDGPTDHAGRVEVKPLEPGRFDVTVTIGDLERSIAAHVVAGRATNVTVDLPAGATVEGKVSHTGKGALPGVMVDIGMSPRVGEAPTYVDRVSTKADEEGRYRLREVPVGTHGIAVRGDAIGYTIPPRSHVVVDSATTVRHDIVLGGTSLSGRVQDRSSRSPIAGARVQIRLQTAGGAGSVPSRTVTTDVRGRYAFKDTCAGTYDMIFTADGHGPATREATVEPDQGTRLDAEMTRAASLLLTLRNDVGQPVTGEVILMVWSATADSIGTNVTADADGRLEYDQAPLGDCRVSIAAAGHERVSRKVDVRPGRNAVDFRLPRTTPTGEVLLTGTVKDATSGDPIAGVMIKPTGASVLFAMTDAEGRFTLVGDAERPTKVWAMMDGWVQRTAKVPKEGPLDIALEQAATIHVHIRRPDGTAHAGSAVLSIAKLDDESGQSFGTGVHADDRGLVTYRRVPLGKCRISVRVQDVGEARVEHEVVQGENEIWLDLEK